MSDRILVMREGRSMGIFSVEEADQEVIMTAAMGQRSLLKEALSMEGAPSADEEDADA